jgi:hypothetical protein
MACSMIQTPGSVGFWIDVDRNCASHRTKNRSLNLPTNEPLTSGPLDSEFSPTDAKSSSKETLLTSPSVQVSHLPLSRITHTASKSHKVPDKDRFNYASFNCAAKTLATNAEAKSAASILMEFKDGYMLNKCSAREKFVVVELCQDILVDTVVLANLEFFSSMFKSIRLSVTDRYPPKNEDGWALLGTFTAQNARNLQVEILIHWTWLALATC